MLLPRSMRWSTAVCEKCGQRGRRSIRSTPVWCNRVMRALGAQPLWTWSDARSGRENRDDPRAQVTRPKPRSRFLPRLVRAARALTVMRQLAERYAAQGQVDLLLSSITKLPTPEVQRDAWLCFGPGRRCCELMKSKHVSGSVTPIRRSRQAAIRQVCDWPQPAVSLR